MSAPRGKVLLVGAGPGAADLITVRAERALRMADVVVHDALVADELLTLVPPDAELVNVGKRGHEAPTRGQEDINALLVERARAGACVVRLKGGDPFVFGRGGEEASACARAGVPFEVVPGVSASVAALAAAGIPVTDRRHAASFAVVTGHKDPTAVREGIRWRALGEAVDTVVILMGMRNLRELLAELEAGGRAPDTPAAAVRFGTRPDQRVVVSTLAALADDVADAGLTSPAAVVVGDVVRLRDELAWFETRPLFGRRVVVTRQPEQAGGMIRALRAAGADPWLVPLIRTEPVRSDAAARIVAELGSFDWVVLTSANAARAFVAAIAAEGGRSAALRAQVLCVGPATAEAAREAGLFVTAVPGARYDAEGLLERIRPHLVPGQRVLLPRAETARPILPEGLRAAGAEVESWTVYRTVAPETDLAALGEALEEGAVDAITFASPSAVRNFADALSEDGFAAALRCVRVAIGPVTAEALAARELPAQVVPARAEAQAMVDALEAHFAKLDDDASSEGGP